jgi:hypothetical protein
MKYAQYISTDDGKLVPYLLPEFILNVSAHKLLGRYSATTGEPQEITLGSNLTLVGNTLNASGGGGGTSNSYFPSGWG